MLETKDGTELSLHTMVFLILMGRLLLFKGCCLIAKSCLTLYDPMDCSPPGFPVNGVSQTRILEGVAISFPDLLDSGIKPVSPALAGEFFTTDPPGKPDGSLPKQRWNRMTQDIIILLRMELSLKLMNCLFVETFFHLVFSDSQ